MGVFQRHAHILMPYLRTWLDGVGKMSVLQDLVGLMAKEVTGDGKFR